MTDAIAVQVWLQDGPGDGAIRTVECGVDGCPPALMMFCGGQLFVGASDQPTPATYATYALVQTAPVEGLWLYRHVGTLTE